MGKTMTALSVICAASVSIAADWSAFRGPHNTGVSDAKNVPVKWNAESNIAWRVDLPGRNNGSPVVSGDRILLTCADAEGRERSLRCFDAHDGSSIWTKAVAYDRKMPTHKTNVYAGTTPVTDGRHIVVWHGSAGLHCYDMDGNEYWQRELGEFRHHWGYGSSPVLHGQTVVLHSGPGQNVFVAAFNLTNGETVWKTDEPVENDGERNNGGKYMGSWSTPVIVQIDGKSVAVCSMSTRVNGYDMETGEILWSCDGLRGERGDLAYTSPVIADEICVAMGGYKGPAIGFRMGGRGNITDTNRRWREFRGTPQRIGSGVFVNGHIYMANAGPNTIECIDPATGKSLWTERGSGGAYWGSIVSANNNLYATDQNGTTIVFKANPGRFEQVSINRLDDPGNSTPAVADSALYIRTFRHLYRIGM